MHLEETGIKFSEIENRKLVGIFIFYAIFAFGMVYFGNPVLIMIPIFFLVYHVIFPLFEKKFFIVRLDYESLFFKTSLWSRPRIIRICDIEKLEPVKLNEQIYMLNIILKDKSVFEYEVHYKYRERINSVVEYLNRLNLK